eukprot:CAMPEP_0119384922 /NCGR_PEP_ID=MMETSP1334-20130426/88387_1 /TAXON_ID=127549 /ORGANISM="Calcidiscus leptoporus, Strain RCC1130" /LENGTH=66 /DNA_ID=CAMNT_0007406077 /DNA_START=18 /DNA_END=219 /DNA_ORIENTATION=+
MESAQSHVFRQAENRMHAQNAIMVSSLERRGRETTEPPWTLPGHFLEHHGRKMTELSWTFPRAPRP